MRRLLPASVLVALVLVTPFTPTHAQHRLRPVAEMTGRPALELALRKLDTVGNLMMTTAHPDDENNALLAYYGHTKGFRTSLVTATRGEGGQNEIGPEIFEALAVLRTEELLDVHKFDGAEQYFTRAVDFGFSFSVEETLEKWGGQVILGDYVRMIRTIRPDVIVGFVFDGEGGGQHHQSSSRLTLQAFRAAADPNAFPDQIAAGLRPWQPKKFYYTAGFGGPGGRGQELQGEGAAKLFAFTGGETYDPILGRTCNELAGEARSMHKCQGMSQLLPLPGVSEGFGPAGPRGYRLRDTVLSGGVNRPDPEMFDGVDTSLASLAGYAGASAPAALTTALSTIGTRVADARTAVLSNGSSAAVAPLAAGLKAVRALRADLKGMNLPAAGLYEIDTRLALKETQFQQALVLAADVRLDAVANDSLIVAGQPVQVQIIAANRGTAPVTLAGTLAGFTGAAGDCAAAPLAPNAARNCRMTATVPADARLTAAHFKYATDAARFVLDADVPAGLPFRPTPFVATVNLTVGGEAVTMPVNVASRSEGNLYSGEKRAELHVVPKFAVNATPEIVIVPATGGPRAARDVRVTVVNHSNGAATAEVVLDAPQGWRVAPATQKVAFSREDEAATVRFTLTPPAPAALAALAKTGAGATVKASVREGGATYAQGYQVVEYPHTTRRHVLRAPEVQVSVLDLKVKPNLTVGYVMGVGDEVPQALEQIGARVELVSEDQLAWGDLGRYDVIMTGVR
ncbi:MAG: PIG-L family deacetylase, partial [Acidobacteria bacterium]|nr:PIG-L family deacetylase [Acidobacteriota bacterium]